MRRQLLVKSRAEPGMETEYKDWYMNVHINDVLAVPGFVSGQFHQNFAPDGSPTGDFSALYEIDEGEISTLMGALIGKRGQMVMTDSLDPDSVSFTFLLPLR